MNAPLPIAPSPAPEWKHIEAVVEIPSDVSGVTPMLFLWKAKGSLQVDDFTFEKVDSSVALSPTDAPAGAHPPEEKKMPVPTQAEIDEVAAMLPEAPRGTGRPITDRDAWSAAAKEPAFQKQVRDAERYAHESTPVLTDALYHEIVRTHQADSFLGPFRKRSTRLNAFVVAECIENQGHYLPLIEHELDAILGEESWVSPSHSLAAYLPDGMNGIDLAVAARGWTVATTDYWLGDKLRPATRERIRAELKRRVFDRYEAAVRGGTAHWWWMDAANNWDAVCNAGVTGAALAILPSRQERALYICAARNSMPYYLQSFSDSGYCREGITYWNYGFGNYLCLSEMIYENTGGKINLFAGDKIRRMALFPVSSAISDGIFPAFGDCHLDVVRPKSPEAGTALLQFINQRWGMGWTDLDPADSDLFAVHPLGDRLGAMGIFGFPLPDYGAGAVPGSPSSPEEAQAGGLRSCFADAGILIARSNRPGAPQLALALKGGDNGAPHGHNDNGTYVVVCNGEALLVDPGAERYTADTFNAHRFESMMLNSYGHDVPYVAGTMQKPGSGARAPITITRFSDDRDTATMDLSGSYAIPGLRKLQRTYVLDRTRPAIEITDEADFDQPADFGSALITVSNWKEEGPGTFLIWGQKSALRATVTIDGATAANTIEPITEHLPSPGTKRTRLGVNLTAPAAHIVMHTLIVPADLPATSAQNPAPGAVAAH